MRRDATASDLVQPGHIFPLQAQDGGVLMRAGHTEAGCDLAAMAGLTPAAVICEVMNDDGTMARLPDLIAFAAQHGLKIGTIASLIEYRSRNESLIERIGARKMLTQQGEFDLHGVPRPRRRRSSRADARPLVGERRGAGPRSRAAVGARPARRRPRRAFVAAAARARRAAAKRARRRRPPQLRRRRRLAAAARPRKSRGARQPSLPMDLRTYGIGAQILRDLGVARMKLLGSPRRMPSLFGYGLEVTGHLADEPAADARPGRSCATLNAAPRSVSTAAICASASSARASTPAHRRRRASLHRRAARARRRGRPTSPHVSVPGALEIGAALNALADADEHDALVAIGCVIRGETYHFELVANESAAA